MFRTSRAIIARRLRATYMDTQLSRFLTVNDRPILAAHPPYYQYGLERTDRTHPLQPTPLCATRKDC
jgi:hypothetical protein